MQQHRLQLDSAGFQLKLDGIKDWTLIKSTLTFEEGDLIQFIEYDPIKHNVTGRQLKREIRAVLQMPGIEKGYRMIVDGPVPQDNNWLEAYHSAIRKFPLEQVYRELAAMCLKVSATPKDANLHKFLGIVLSEIKRREP